ncbi:hypothetical protein D477_003103 [Arthrobacter crystallopoietes BAB-32]|uniref:Uncharacterized protein n=1 Tax=Arthrobacter crystallopoietes BAB-32 TaxID=1246476 RepID=N1V6K1_9MICC|nr:hypothetical protein [Arthrobacter crystallopoietes]EMY35649.1 hypothetical protein D477_003103 [Arthrobacter crystallopoietes BAB-32]
MEAVIVTRIAAVGIVVVCLLVKATRKHPGPEPDWVEKLDAPISARPVSRRTSGSASSSDPSSAYWAGGIAGSGFFDSGSSSSCDSGGGGGCD